MHRPASAARPTTRISRALTEFLHAETSGGIVMLAATALALLIANSAGGDAYRAFWKTYAGLTVGDWTLKLSLGHWINDGLMAVFFFLVGLEIKRELLFGELASPRKAALPVVAALGGAVVPAGVFVLLNAGGPYLRGWGVPMATDIAFAVTILALLGSRAPLWLKSFVTALAIADDILAVLVIALFYSASIDTAALAWSGAVLAGLFLLNRGGVRHPAPYVLLTVLLWFFVLRSGVHATIAGVAAAAFIPASLPRRRADARSQDLSRSMRNLDGVLASLPPDHELWEEVDAREAVLEEIVDDAAASSALLYRLEHAIHPWSAFVVLPVFAFANAGVEIPFAGLGEALTHPLALGIAAGLFVGKQVGITLFAWLATRLRLGELPGEARWTQIWGGGLLAGIGFTMSIFIASLAFTDSATLDRAKIGIIAGSLLSALAGIAVLRAASPAGDGDEG
ncbi:MAG: Na+/H+ antiporter NhaA [Gemmatimonadota bacterium]|nr:Na+/H+ antiporter NhaA [Gemmatimonadota bacterium]